MGLLRLDRRVAGTPLWVVGALTTGCIVAVLLMLAAEVPLAWVWWAICVVATVPVVVWFIAHGRFFEPLPLIAAACALLFVARPLQLFLEWRDLFSYFFPSDSVESLTLLEGQEIALYVGSRLDESLETALSRGLAACALFLVVLLVGYRLGLGGRLAGGLSKLGSGVSISAGRAIGVSLAVGIVAQVAIVARAGGPKASLESASDQAALSDSFALFMLSGFGFVAVFIWAAWRWPRVRAEWVAFALSTAAVCGFSVISGSRARVFLTLMVLAVVVHYTRRAWRGRELAVGLLVLLAFASSFIVFRRVADDGSLSEAARTAPAHVLDVRVILNDITSFDHVLYATNIYGRERGYRHGSFLIGGIRSYLPRRIDSGKPDGGDIVFRRVVWREQFGAGRPPTVVGDLFIDFGFWGVAVGALLIGMLARALVGLVRGPPGGREYRVVLFAFSLVVLYEVVVDTFSVALGYALTLLVPFLIAVHIFGRVVRRTPSFCEGSRRVKHALLIVSCAVALAFAGCGGFGDDEVTERVQRSALLSKAQVERLPANSPERAVFEWWRALQFDNAVVAARYYADSLGLSEADIEGILRKGPQGRGLDKRPRLVEVQRQGDKAVVLTLLEVEQRNPNGRIDRQQQARAFNLVREDGEWKLAENNYLDRSLDIERRFREEFERQQGQGQGQESP